MRSSKPPSSPRTRMHQKQQQQQQTSPAVAANDESEFVGVRTRADSTGSTRGAFYSSEHAPANSHVVPKKKKTRKLPPPPPPAPQSGRVTSSAEKSASNNDYDNTKHGQYVQQQQHTTPPRQPYLLSSATFDMLPEADIPTRSGGRLSTIRDDSSSLIEESERPLPLDNSNDTTLGGEINYVSQLYTPTIFTETDLHYGMPYGTYSNQNIYNMYFTGSNNNNSNVPITREQEEIAKFASMANAGSGYGAVHASPVITQRHKPIETSFQHDHDENDKDTDHSEAYEDSMETLSEETEEESLHGLRGFLIWLLDPVPWLIHDMKVDENGRPYFDETLTCAAMVRHFLFNPIDPEFTSLQQFCWAVIIGVLMGIFSAAWKFLIEAGIDFFWRTVPEFLLRMGVFSPDYFPLYHYMWICPAVFGGILSYVSAVVPNKIPDQNDWITNVHNRGVQDYRGFWALFAVSTAGMWSALSLGPESPLVLTAGMFGSWLGLATKQSLLQARIMNLTAGSAAVAGFFGFPMAGALFVLELPHRMGLQYFEALSPATISSIVAVLSNRLMIGNDVTGYYSYPFLTETLPSVIFTHAIVYGLFGAFIGILYAVVVKKIKVGVHDLFHAEHHESSPTATDHDGSKATNAKEETEVESDQEDSPLLGKTTDLKKNVTHRSSDSTEFCVIRNDARRAGAVGVLAGAMVGVIGIFVPHVMFWGEAQLQNLIDKGRTPLPVFGQGDEPTAALVSLGMCMVDPQDRAAVKAGFSVGCAALISIGKMLAIGLSIGTGLPGGHFWGPLFVGCSASHFLTDIVRLFDNHFGFGSTLAAYPCLVILCTMGSAHVVTFRAHMAIMLILTLTISAFDPADDVNGNFAVAGDYSAVFPLLVVSVFVALMVSRDTVFYGTQRNRGDIMAVPEVLCEPGMEGRPMVYGFEVEPGSDRKDAEFGANVPGVTSAGDRDLELALEYAKTSPVRNVDDPTTQYDIEREFEQMMADKSVSLPIQNLVANSLGVTPDKKEDLFAPVSRSDGKAPLSSARLDELLSRPMESASRPPRLNHRRTQSAPTSQLLQNGGGKEASRKVIVPFEPAIRFDSNRDRANSTSSRGNLVRIDSYGEIQQSQPSLLDQARTRSASSAMESRHRRAAGHRRKNSDASAQSASAHGGISGHSRKNSEASFGSNFAGADAGALGLDDFEGRFNAIVDQHTMGMAFSGGAVWTDNNSDGEIS